MSDVDIDLAKRHVYAIRNYRTPSEPVGTIEVMDWLIAEIERLREELAEANAKIERLNTIVEATWLEEPKSATMQTNTRIVTDCGHPAYRDHDTICITPGCPNAAYKSPKHI